MKFPRDETQPLDGQHLRVSALGQGRANWADWMTTMTAHRIARNSPILSPHGQDPPVRPKISRCLVLCSNDNRPRLSVGSFTQYSEVHNDSIFAHDGHQRALISPNQTNGPIRPSTHSLILDCSPPYLARNMGDNTTNVDQQSSARLASAGSTNKLFE